MFVLFMARMDGTETIVTYATSKSQSLRTTIPVFVVKQLGLEERDHLDWKVDKDGKTWMAVITKKK